MAVFVGLDIGGTKIMVAAADREGNILRRARTATSTSLETDLANINNMIAEVAGGRSDHGHGCSHRRATGLGTGNRLSPAPAGLAERAPQSDDGDKMGLSIPGGCRHQCRRGGRVSLGRISARRFLYLTLSTGMGGGFLIDGKIYRGQDGAHPEVGHQSIHFRCSNPRQFNVNAAHLIVWRRWFQAMASAASMGSQPSVEPRGMGRSRL